MVQLCSVRFVIEIQLGLGPRDRASLPSPCQMTQAGLAPILALDAIPELPGPGNARHLWAIEHNPPLILRVIQSLGAPQSRTRERVTLGCVATTFPLSL